MFKSYSSEKFELINETLTKSKGIIENALNFVYTLFIFLLFSLLCVV